MVTTRKGGGGVLVVFKEPWLLMSEEHQNEEKWNISKQITWTCEIKHTPLAYD